MTLDVQKTEFLARIKRGHNISRQVIVPQLGMLFIAGIFFSAVSGYELYSAIVIFREKAHEEKPKGDNSPAVSTDLLQKGISVLLAGECQRIGFRRKTIVQ
jgi:hypothetical protein